MRKNKYNSPDHGERNVRSGDGANHSRLRYGKNYENYYEKPETDPRSSGRSGRSGPYSGRYNDGEQAGYDPYYDRKSRSSDRYYEGQGKKYDSYYDYDYDYDRTVGRNDPYYDDYEYGRQDKRRPSRHHDDGNLSYKPKKTRPKKHGCLFSLLKVAGVLLVLGLLIFGIIRFSFGRMDHLSLNEDNLKRVTEDRNMKNYRNIVLFGVDDQDNMIKDKGSRTDCIIVASIHKMSHKVKLMSIYRDTYVSIDGNYDKINAAYSFGGPELAIQTINRNLDLDIKDFATVNFKALADAVDILGGIELTIKSEKELKNLNDYIGNMNKINGGHSEKFDQVGTYTFDGNQAVAYSRIRYMEGGDHERANHQRIVVDGIMKKAKQQPWKIPAIASKVLPQCKTSLSANDLTMLTTTLFMTDISDSQAYPFHSADARYNGIYYGFPKTVRSNAQEAHQYLFGTEDYQVSEELGKISDKVQYITDSYGY